MPMPAPVAAFRRRSAGAAGRKADQPAQFVEIGHAMERQFLALHFGGPGNKRKMIIAAPLALAFFPPPANIAMTDRLGIRLVEISFYGIL